MKYFYNKITQLIKEQCNSNFPHRGILQKALGFTLDFLAAIALVKSQKKGSLSQPSSTQQTFLNCLTQDFFSFPARQNFLPSFSKNPLVKNTFPLPCHPFKKFQQTEKFPEKYRKRQFITRVELQPKTELNWFWYNSPEGKIINIYGRPFSWKFGARCKEIREKIERTSIYLAVPGQIFCRSNKNYWMELSFCLLEGKILTIYASKYGGGKQGKSTLKVIEDFSSPKTEYFCHSYPYLPWDCTNRQITLHNIHIFCRLLLQHLTLKQTLNTVINVMLQGEKKRGAKNRDKKVFGFHFAQKFSD